MSTFKQVAKDYARDHGLTENDVQILIQNGELQGIEDDGVLYVRFQVEEKPNQEIKKKTTPTQETTPKQIKTKTEMKQRIADQSPEGAIERKENAKEPVKQEPVESATEYTASSSPQKILWITSFLLSLV